MTGSDVVDEREVLLARRVRSLTDVEADDGGRDPNALAALVNRHVAGNMPPAALVVPPEAFARLLALLPPDTAPPGNVLRTVGLDGDPAEPPEEKLEAALACVEAGAAELQYVLTAEAVAADFTFALVRDLKLACGPRVPLKVMLQGAGFRDENLATEAVDIALQGGADMVGLELEDLAAPDLDGMLDSILSLAARLQEADRPVGLKLRGGRQLLASLDEARIVLNLAARLLGSPLPAASQLRFAGPGLDDAVLTLLRRAQASRR